MAAALQVACNCDLAPASAQTELFFMIMGGTGVLCGILLNVVDCCVSRYPVLNWTDERLRAAKKAAGELLDDEVASAAGAPLLGVGADHEDSAGVKPPVSH